MENLTLSPDQQEAFTLAGEGHNALITGPGGTGKSWLVERLIEHLPNTSLTASTGIAGVNIGGRTIHSWSGLGLARETADELVDKITTRNWHQDTRDRIRACSTLIIDEISMLGTEFMGKLDQVLRAVRNNEQPFGGIQLLMFGDFLQLPPVKDQPFFTSELWTYMLPVVKVLTTIHRQKDKEFAELLQRVRICQHTVEDCLTLKGLAANQPVGTPIILHTHNNIVDQCNATRLKQLNKKVQSFSAIDTGTDKAARSQLDKNCLSPAVLELSVDSRVMCTQNRGGGLCNGSLGTVIEIRQGISPEIRVDWDDVGPITMTRGEWEITDTATREVLARRKQFPLRLAWAITVHKSQGLTFDNAIAYLEKCFTPGQAYVALSRMSNMKHLTLPRFDPRVIKADFKALAFYKNPHDPSSWGAKPVQTEIKFGSM